MRRPRTPCGIAVLVYDVDRQGGGMERQAHRLASELRARGHDTRLLLATQPGLFRLPEYGGFVGTTLGVPFLRTPLAVHELMAGSALLARRRRVSVLYAVGLTMGLIAARLGRALERPVVLKLACGGELGDAAVLARHAGSRALLAALDAAVARFVCPSAEVESEWRALGFGPERLARIPNGVDLERFRPRERTPSGPRRVLFVGRLDEQKRPRVLLRAFARARAAADAELALAGGGSQRAELGRLAEELGLGARVRFLGPRDDVPELLAGAAAFVLPSSGEGVSNSLLEALASGVPSIVTSIAANADVTGDAALQVPLDDEAALATAIDRVLSEPALALRLATAGRARAEAEFGLAGVVERYEALFEQVSREAARPATEPSAARLALRLVSARLFGNKTPPRSS